MRVLVVISILASLLSGCGDSRTDRETLDVLAAASLADAMTELARVYENETGVRVRCHVAASSTLARQVLAGAPADVFVSANPRWMDELAAADRLEPGTRRDLAGNRLALVTRRDRIEAITALGSAFPDEFEGRLAMGDPSHVPAGLYARAALTELGWWEALDENVLPAVDVRAALRLVEMGEADAGFVYASDLRASPDVAEAPLAAWPAPPIRYPVAVLRGAAPGAEAFVEFLRDDRAGAILRDHGFHPLEADTP